MTSSRNLNTQVEPLVEAFKQFAASADVGDARIFTLTCCIKKPRPSTRQVAYTLHIAVVRQIKGSLKIFNAAREGDLVQFINGAVWNQPRKDTTPSHWRQVINSMLLNVQRVTLHHLCNHENAPSLANCSVTWRTGKSYDTTARIDGETMLVTGSF